MAVCCRGCFADAEIAGLALGRRVYIVGLSPLLILLLLDPLPRCLVDSSSPLPLLPRRTTCCTTPTPSQYKADEESKSGFNRSFSLFSQQRQRARIILVTAIRQNIWYLPFERHVCKEGSTESRSKLSQPFQAGEHAAQRERPP
jgi:hypothetical protein